MTTTTSASDRLRAKIDLAYPAVQSHASRIWRSPDVRELYPRYLRAMHAVVRSARPLIETARDVAAARAGDDRVAAGLVDYLARHAEEEAGHDDWLLEDLAVTGHDPADVLDGVPSAAAAGLAGSQYYWIHHFHPVALVGHMVAIEGHPPPVGFADHLQELTGYPRSAFRSIRRHETLDLLHQRDLFDLVDALPLGQRHERALGMSALHTLKCTIDVIDEVRIDQIVAPGDSAAGTLPAVRPRIERGET